MSQENVEIVRGMWDPLTGIDIAGFDWGAAEFREILEGLYSPDVELRTLESAAGIGPSALYRGWDGMVRYLQEWFEPFSEYRIESLDYIDVGKRVLVPIRVRGVGGGSGIEVNMELTMSFEFQDGKITRVDEYDAVDEALEAAGLSE